MKRYWKDSFCSMEPQVDQDHRTLFKLLDRVSTHRRESDIDDINQLLDQLLEYTFDHFAREERAMKARDYPKTAQHSKEHVAMRKAFIESLRKVVKGSFTYHFETEDMTWVCWQQRHRTKEPDSAPMDH